MSVRLKPVLAILLVALVAALAWRLGPWRQDAAADAFVSGNGRIEGTEIAVASKLPGRLQEVLVGEGDFVKAGQPLYQIDPATYQANHESAKAALARAEAQAQSARTLAERYEGLVAANAVSKQSYDDAVAANLSAQADVASARAARTMSRFSFGLRRPIRVS